MRTQSHRRRSAICVTSVLSCFQSLSQLALHFSSLSCTCNLTSNAFTLAQDIVPQRKTCCKLSGRVQELQNEVNCMNDSKDFQDAESIRSGNSHVTSRPVSFPPHPIPEGMLRHSFLTSCRREGPPSIWDTHGTSGNVFLQIQMRHHQHLIHKNCVNGIHRSKSRSIHPQWRKVKGKNKIKI